MQGNALREKENHHLEREHSLGKKGKLEIEKLPNAAT